VAVPSDHQPRHIGDLATLRIDRYAAPRRRWLLWLVLVAFAAVGALAYPSARRLVEERRAPQVDVARATALPAPAAGGSGALPVLVATGYVVARHSSDVGVKTGGRIATIRFEEGTRVRRGQVIAEIEHADTDAQLEAARRAVAETEAQRAQAMAQRDEDARTLERQRALAKDGIATAAALSAADAAAQVAEARVRSSEAAIASARARVRVAEEALENTNVRAPFDGAVIKKRAEVGETVSPFGVAGQATRDGGAIATIADLSDLEVQTEVSENSVAKLLPAMPAEVKLQAYPDQIFRGRLRQIFPSADRAKAIVEVRVSILNADAHVKPEMTASVTFQEPATARPAETASAPPSTPAVLVPKRAVSGQGSQASVWVVNGGVATRRTVTLGADRIEQVEVRSGLVPGEAIIVGVPAGLADGSRVRVSPR
jgi:HlyD family secretion protein